MEVAVHPDHFTSGNYSVRRWVNPGTILGAVKRNISYPSKELEPQLSTALL
jgi:hypothetical protein